MEPEITRILRELHDPNLTASIVPAFVALGFIAAIIFGVVLWLLFALVLPPVFGWLSSRVHFERPRILEMITGRLDLVRFRLLKVFRRKSSEVDDRSLPAHVPTLRKKISELTMDLEATQQQLVDALRTIEELKQGLSPSDPAKLESRLRELENEIAQAASDIKQDAAVPTDIVSAMQAIKERIGSDAASQRSPEEQAKEIGQMQGLLAAYKDHMFRATGGKPFESNVSPK